MEFFWDRRPDEEKVLGRIEVGEDRSLQSSLHSWIATRAPQAALALPHLPQVSAVEIQGTLPRDLKGPKKLTLNLVGRDGKAVAATIGLDPTEEPMGVSVALSELNVPLTPILDLLPKEYASLPNGGSCVLHSLEASGPMGDWKSWNVALESSLAMERVEIPEGRGSIRDVNLTLKGRGGWPAIQGKASLRIGSAETPKLSEPIAGVRIEEMIFSADLPEKDFDLSGNWSIAEAPGGAYSGMFSYSSARGYRLEGRNTRIDISKLGIDLRGAWAGSFEAAGKAEAPQSPSVSLSLKGEGVRYEQYDFTPYPIVLEAKGRRLSEDAFFLNQGRFVWGPALQLTLGNTEASRSGVIAERIELGGDLDRLMRFLPPGKAPSGWRSWINPKGWRLRSGLRLMMKPEIQVKASKAELDLGNGQRAHFNFEYAGQSGQWDLNTWPMTLSINHLLKTFRVGRVEANGQLRVQANVSGNTKSSGGVKESLVAKVEGEVIQSNGRLRGKSSTSKPGAYRLGWRNLNGGFQVSMEPRLKRLSTDLRFQNWGWYAEGGKGQSSVGGVHVKVRGRQEGDSHYFIDEFLFTEGNGEPIRVELSGMAEKRGERWHPQMKVRLEARDSPPIPASPNMEVEGSGVFTASVVPSRSGNWILEGNVEGRGLDIRVPTRPLIIENLRGVIPIENVRLDEYFFHERWDWRNHPFPRDPLGPNVVDRAFVISGGDPPNAQMDRLLVDDDDYRNMIGRMVMIDDVFYINSFKGLQAGGDFPLKGTGYLFIRPGKGAGMRIRGYSSKIPMGVAVPGLGNLGVEHDAVKIDWYNYQEPGETKIETRHLYFDIPVGKIFKKIPLLGDILFGWTPDSLNAYELTIQRRKGGEYHVLEEGDPGLIPTLPVFNKTDESFEAPPPEPDGGFWDGIKGTAQKVFRVGE